MRSFLLAFLSFLLAAGTAQAAMLSCEHEFMGTPFATVELEILPDGTLGPGAKVTNYGRSHLESVSPEQAGAGELFHLWISKESPQNAVEMIVYQKNGESIPAKLINHNVPIGQEVPGTCRYLP